MRRLPRYVPSLLLVLTTATPFVVGCDLFKPIAVEAGADSSVVSVGPDPNLTAPANPATPGATTVAPLNPAAPTTAVVVKTDGGVVADSGVKTDGAAPAPMPTFPGIDAGAFKGFDAGNLFKVPDGGFKPPWPVPTK